MAFVKKAVEGVTAPAKAVGRTVKANPLAIVGVLILVFIAFRFRSQIMGAIGKIPYLGSGASKLSGEG